jgi:hypothetical protein
MFFRSHFCVPTQALRVWEEYVKSNGKPRGKQARDLVYELPPDICAFAWSLIEISSRTVAGAWITLQIEHRSDLGVNIDYKAAQAEGEEKNQINDHRFQHSPPPLCFPAQREMLPWTHLTKLAEHDQSPSLSRKVCFSLNCIT